MSRKARSQGKNNSKPMPAGSKILAGFFRVKFGRKPYYLFRKDKGVVNEAAEWYHIRVR